MRQVSSHAFQRHATGAATAPLPMSTRFYAGPISSGMGRCWDDWLDPGQGIAAAPWRERVVVAPANPPLVPSAPLPASSPDTRQRRIDPTPPR